MPRPRRTSRVRSAVVRDLRTHRAQSPLDDEGRAFGPRSAGAVQDPFHPGGSRLRRALRPFRRAPPGGRPLSRRRRPRCRRELASECTAPAKEFHMNRARPIWLAALATVAILAGCDSPPPLAAGGVTAGWPVYGGDAGGSRYSPLDQISRANVRFLKEAWRIRTGDLDAIPPPPGHMAFEATPILVGGLLVLPDAARPRARARSGDRRRALALRRHCRRPPLSGVHVARRGRVDRLRRAGATRPAASASSPRRSSRDSSRSTPAPARSARASGRTERCRSAKASARSAPGNTRSPRRRPSQAISSWSDPRWPTTGASTCPRASCAPTTRAAERSSGRGIRFRAAAKIPRSSSGDPRTQRA